MKGFIETRMQLMHMRIIESKAHYADPLVFIYMNRNAFNYLNGFCTKTCGYDDLELYGYKAFVIDDDLHPAFTFTIGERADGYGVIIAHRYILTIKPHTQAFTG